MKRLKLPASTGFCPKEESKPCGKTCFAWFAQLSRSQLPPLQRRKPTQGGMCVVLAAGSVSGFKASQADMLAGLTEAAAQNWRAPLCSQLISFGLPPTPLYLFTYIPYPNIIVIIMFIFLLLLDPKFLWKTSHIYPKYDYKCYIYITQAIFLKWAYQNICSLRCDQTAGNHFRIIIWFCLGRTGIVLFFSSLPGLQVWLKD